MNFCSLMWFLFLRFFIFVSLQNPRPVTPYLTQFIIWKLTVQLSGNDCLEIIKKEVDEQNFTTWFKPIVPLSRRSGVTIQVPSQFFTKWLEENYVPVLKKAIRTVLGENSRLEYSVIIDSGKPAQCTPHETPMAMAVQVTKQPVGNGNGKPDDYSPFDFSLLKPANG